MPITLIYQYQFHNFEGALVDIQIEDKESFVDDITALPQYVTLADERHRVPAQAFTVKTANNEGNKFAPIRAKVAELRFFSNTQIDFSTFSKGEDDRFKVTAKVEGNTIFVGNLVMSGNRTRFLPHPNVVVLTATDNIALLKDVDLTDFDGNTPKGKHRIIDFIAWALSKTKISLPINIVNNLMEESFPGDSAWDKIYLESKTFESEVGQCHDCYTVLEKILKETMFLEQRQGKWWIIRIDEMDVRGMMAHQYLSDGTFEGIAPAEFYRHGVGKMHEIQFINESTIVGAERPCKTVKETYRYDYPKEIIDNINFDRGEYYAFIATPTNAAYHLEDWILSQGNPQLNTAPVTNAYIRRVLESGYEKERYVVIEKKPAGTSPHILRANKFHLGVKDKFSFSVDASFDVNLTGASGETTDFFAQVRLYGDDGKYYTLDDGRVEQMGKWMECDANFFTNQRYVGRVWNKTLVDDRDWFTVSAEAQPLPTDGEIEVLLIQSSQYGEEAETRFQNLQFNYTPYINGSYLKYSGQYHKAGQEKEYRKTVDEQVFLSDSPKHLFKGAMFKFIDGKWKLTGNWYDGSIFTNGLPPADNVNIEKPLILVHHRNNVNNDADYSYVGWFVYLSEVAPQGYYLVNGYESAYHDTSAYPPDPPLPPSTIPLSGLTFKGATQADVIQNTRFSNHYVTNQSAFDTTTNIVLITGITQASSNIKPYGFFVAASVWNQAKWEGRTLDASLLGLRSTGGNYPDMIHTYIINDESADTRNRLFQLLNMEQDWASCTWSGTLSECFDFIREKDYSGLYEFKYMENR